jgi:hypothetical protein
MLIHFESVHVIVSYKKTMREFFNKKKHLGKYFLLTLGKNPLWEKFFAHTWKKPCYHFLYIYISKQQTLIPVTFFISILRTNFLRD